MSTMAYWREPAIPVRHNKRSESNSMGKMNGDKLQNLKKAHAVNRKEFSQTVQSSNSTLRKHLRKKLDFWYKEQNSVLNNMRKDQESMYQALLRVNKEKKLLQMQAYAKEQEKLRQKMDENIKNWKSKNNVSSVLDMFGDTPQEASKKRARTKTADNSMEVIRENEETGNKELNGGEAKKKRQKETSEKTEADAMNSELPKLINTEHAATDERGNSKESQDRAETIQKEKPSKRKKSDSTTTAHDGEKGACDPLAHNNTSTQQEIENAKDAQETLKQNPDKSNQALEPLKLVRSGSMFLKTATFRKLEPVFEDEFSDARANFDDSQVCDKQTDLSNEDRRLDAKPKTNIFNAINSAQNDKVDSLTQADDIVHDLSKNECGALTSDQNSSQSKTSPPHCDNSDIVVDQVAPLLDEVSLKNNNDDVHVSKSSQSNRGSASVSDKGVSLARLNRLQKVEKDAKFKELLNKETVVVYQKDETGNYIQELNPYKRSSFGLPSRREQHRREKILQNVREFDGQQRRKEAQFFKDLQEVLEEDRKAEMYIPPKPDTPPPQKPKEVPRLSIFDLRSFGQAPAEDDPDSIGALEKCSYLRAYSPEKARRGRASSDKVTSWNMENGKL